MAGTSGGNLTFLNLIARLAVAVRRSATVEER